MSLTVGLDIARSGLSVTAEQTAVVSRNVARASDPQASRKTANVITGPGGGVRVASITRTTDAALFENLLESTSSSVSQTEIVNALATLDQTINDPELGNSPAALVGGLADAIQEYTTGPEDPVRANAAVSAASDLAGALNSATATVQEVRQQADAAIGDSVDRLNSLLSQFETVNTEIVKGTRSSADITDYLDQRDAILKSISEEIGIRTLARSDNDLVIYTDSGVTLFETKARTVAFEPSIALAPGSAGNAVYVDGVPVTGGGSLAIDSGRLAGLTAVRDEITVTYQSQLDEIARGLIEAFAESDQSGVLPDAAGLFTYPGAPAIPATGTIVSGLAGTIRVNATVDPRQGGNASLLRDGGISDPGNPAYTYNTTGASGYSARLQELIDRLAEPRSFDVAAGATSTSTVAGFASSSVAYLEEARNRAQAEADYRTTLSERSVESLSKATGVNLDEELTNLLDLERSYQASARLISTIDGLFDSLLEIVR